MTSSYHHYGARHPPKPPISPIYRNSRFQQFYEESHHVTSTPSYRPLSYPHPPPWFTPSYPPLATRAVNRGEDTNFRPKRLDSFPRPGVPPKHPMKRPPDPPKPPQDPLKKVIRFKSRGQRDTYVVFIADKGKLSLQGSFKMKVLAGLVYSYGHIYKPSDTMHTMYSPSDSMPLDLSDIPDEILISKDDQFTRDMLKHHNVKIMPKSSHQTLPLSGTPYTKRRMFKGVLEVDLPKEDCSLLNSEILPMYKSQHRAALLLVQANDSPLIPFVTNAGSYYPFVKDIFNNFNGKENVFFPYLRQVFSSENTLQITQEWCQVADHISLWKAPVVVFLGQANLGKSTLARFVVNRLLNKFPRVAFLECDVGQTEFTPPGILSLNVVDQPLTGPPFTHQRDPVIAHYFGEYTPSVQPEYYVRLVHSLVKFYREKLKPEHPNLPLVVNTCGWLRDLGAALALDILRISAPSHIVRLRSFVEPALQHGFLPELNAEYIQNAPGFLTRGDGFFWRDAESGGGEDYDGREGERRREAPEEEPGEVTQMWTNEGNMKQDLMRIFEISGLAEDVEEEEEVYVEGRTLGEGEIPTSAKKTKMADQCEETSLPELPSNFWRRTGGIEICSLRCKQWSKRSTNHRALATLAYFSRYFVTSASNPNQGQPSCLHPTPESVLDMPVYVVDFKNIAVHTLKCEVPRSTILYCFLGSLVAMVRVEENQILSFEDEFPGMVKFVNTRFPIAEFIGLGFVTNIDTREKVFRISTPLEEERLQRVNLLLLGKNEVPPFFYPRHKDTNTPHFIKDWPNLPISHVTSLSIKQRHSDHQ